MLPLFFKVVPTHDSPPLGPAYDQTSNGSVFFQAEVDEEEEDEWQGGGEDLKDIFDRLFMGHNDGVRRILGQVITQGQTESSEVDSQDALPRETNRKRSLAVSNARWIEQDRGSANGTKRKTSQ